MQSREVHTRESFIEAQLDAVSFSARALLPLVAADLWFTGDPAPDGTPERRRQVALELLAEWNGEMNEHLPEPLLYAAWMRALQDRLIRDELGPLADEFTHVNPLFIEKVFRDVDGAARWCDIAQSRRRKPAPRFPGRRWTRRFCGSTNMSAARRKACAGAICIRRPTITRFSAKFRFCVGS